MSSMSYLMLDGVELSNSARLYALAQAGFVPPTYQPTGPSCGVLQREAANAAGGSPCAFVGFSDEFSSPYNLGPISTPAPYLNNQFMFTPQGSPGMVGGPTSDGYMVSIGLADTPWDIPQSAGVWSDGVVALAFEPLAPITGNSVRVYTHATGSMIQTPGNPPVPTVGDYVLMAQLRWQSSTTAQMTLEGRDSTLQYQPGFASGAIVTVPRGRQWLVIRTAGMLVTAEWWTSDPRFGGTPWQTLAYTLTTSPFVNGNGLSEIDAFGQPGVQGIGMGGQPTQLASPEWWAAPTCNATCSLYPSPFLYPQSTLFPAMCGSTSSILQTTPWTDSSRPESPEFLGLLIDDVQGLDGGTTRSVDQRAGGLGGASLGPIVQTGRQLKFHGWLVAQSCRGLDYGREWLNDRLASTCHPCPDSIARLRVAVPSPDDGSNDSQGLYILYDVGLTEGPVVGPASLDCDLAEVTFTLTTGNGFKYQAAKALLAASTFASLNGSVSMPVPSPPGLGTNGAIITIRAGSQPLLNVSPVTQLATYPSDLLYPTSCLYPNDGGSPVTLPLTTCPSGFVIPLIPAGGTLIIDSARHVITYIDPAGVVQDGTFLLAQDTARAIDWLEADACNPSGADTVYVGAGTYGPDATVQIDYQHRER